MQVHPRLAYTQLHVCIGGGGGIVPFYIQGVTSFFSLYTQNCVLKKYTPVTDYFELVLKLALSFACTRSEKEVSVPLCDITKNRFLEEAFYDVLFKKWVQTKGEKDGRSLAPTDRKETCVVVGKGEYNRKHSEYFVIGTVGPFSFL